MIRVVIIKEWSGKRHFSDFKELAAKDAVELLLKKEVGCGGRVSVIERKDLEVIIEVINRINGYTRIVFFRFFKGNGRYA